MESLVNMIEITKKNILELEDMAKKNAKALVALTQEKEDIEKNLTMFRKVLDNLTGIKDYEIRVAMGEVPVEKKEEKIWPRPAKKVNLIDENGEIVETYKSQGKAAQKLGISEYKIVNQAKLPEKDQIEKFGYALAIA